MELFLKIAFDPKYPNGTRVAIWEPKGSGGEDVTSDSDQAQLSTLSGMQASFAVTHTSTSHTYLPTPLTHTSSYASQGSYSGLHVSGPLLPLGHCFGPPEMAMYSAPSVTIFDGDVVVLSVFPIFIRSPGPFIFPLLGTASFAVYYFNLLFGAKYLVS